MIPSLQLIDNERSTSSQLFPFTPLTLGHSHTCWSHSVQLSLLLALGGWLNGTDGTEPQSFNDG